MRTAKILSLRWAHRSFCWFCHEAAHIFSGYIEVSHSRNLGSGRLHDRTAELVLVLQRPRNNRGRAKRF